MKTTQFLSRILTLLATAFILALAPDSALAAAPNIVVEQPVGTDIPDGGSKDFGQVVAGSNTSLTFTIKNTGDANLNGLAVSKDPGGTAGDFTVTSQPAASVGGPGSTTFTVQFTPTGTGIRTATLHIANNDPVATKQLFDITVTGTGTAPVMEVEQPTGTALANNATKNFGAVLLGSSQTLTFRVKNTAAGANAGPLNLSITKDGADAGFFAVSAISPLPPIAAGSFSEITVTFSPTTTPRTFTAALHLTNNDPGNTPFHINLTGIGAAPDLKVEAPVGTPVGPGHGPADFGTVTVNDMGNLTFTITNSGTADLQLPTPVTLTGDRFVLKSQPTTAPIPPSGTTSFVVQFLPTAPGAATGTVTIPNNVAGKNPYVINLQGNGGPPPINSDAFGYTMAIAAPVAASSFLATGDSDVFKPAALLGDDEFLTVDLGFSFSFYEKTYTKVFVSTNGILTFDAGTRSYTPSAIPSQSFPNNCIAPFWTDLDMRASGQVLYATRGTAPNRVFIVKWDAAPEFGNNTKATTFQVLLYENTNTIEFQYQRLDTGFGTNRNVAIGIASRDYGITQPQPKGGVVGLKYAFGNISTAGTAFPTAQVKTVPAAVRFTRPVIFAVESLYAKPTAADPTLTEPTVTPVLGSKDQSIYPPAGETYYGTPSGTVQRFEAPEVIYLNKNFAKLPAVGNVNDPDPLKVAWYRLVNDGYAIDGQVVQGTHAFFTTTLTHDVTVVWRWRLEYAAIISSATGEGGFGNPAPVVGRAWHPLGSQFTAAIDSAIEAPGAFLRFRTVGYSLYDKNDAVLAPGITFPSDAAARRATTPMAITEPLRLVWNFTGQVRYRFDAAASESPNTSLNGQSFVRIYKPDRVTLDSTVYGNALNTDVWIDSGNEPGKETGRKVEVGVFYRSKDRQLTLDGLGGAPNGDLATLQSINLLEDTKAVPDPDGRVARIFTVRNAAAPTEIHWVFQPTIFRADVPLGLSLDGLNRNNQLVPALPTGVSLKVSDPGPGNTITTKVVPPDGSLMTGDPLRWDGLGKALFPVRPGIYEVAWPAGNNPGKKLKVEILTGYPEDIVTRTVAIEDMDGFRIRQGTATLTSCVTTHLSTSVTCASTTGLLPGMIISGPDIATGTTVAAVANATTFVLSAAATGNNLASTLTAWNYLYKVTLPPIDPKAGFPAQAEQAHYHHLFDPAAGRQAPTKLDLSGTDEWKFQDLTFADAGAGVAVNKAATGIPFTATSAGRSVHLFSFRPNADEVADGTLTKENLAVRVVRSSAVNVLTRNDPKLVLGHHALKLGSGAHGIIQTGGAPPTAAVVPGTRFVVDFWLNAKGLQPPAAVTLTNCATLAGSTSVTCASTANVVPGMSLSGPTLAAGTKIASITNGTTLVLSAPAAANGSALSMTASNKPVTVFSTGGDGLKVTLDAAASVVTATYRGVRVSHGLSKAGVAWKHYAIHVFTHTFFGVGVTVVDFYLDGVREEQGFVTSWFPGTADSVVGSTVTPNSLRFGVGAETRSGLQLDNFRLFGLGADPLGYLSPGEVRTLRAERDMTPVGKRLRGVSPQLSFDFETQPASGRFANQGTLANVGVGPIAGSGTFPDTWADADLQEVATQLTSTLDNAGFGGSGYILNAVSNYNPRLYQRSAEVGTWGPIFPVNHSQLFKDAAKKLEVAYYENPYLTDPLPHPNVAWPYAVTEYDDVVFPSFGPNRDKAIYIASRIGSEGVDNTGRPQVVYDLARYSGLEIYHQPDRTAAGYNPNEEHALTAPSGRAALKVKNLGEDLANNPPLAAFALQHNLNNKPSYTSDPWVLVQVNNLESGEPEMAAYKVVATRSGTVPFPRPTDSQVGGSTGLAYEPAAAPEQRFLTLAPDTAFNFSYQFEYPVFAGDLLVPPYPLNLVLGNASMADERGGNIQVGTVNQRTLWRDASMHAWVVSGGGKFFEQFFYPMRADFYLPGAAVGRPVAWLPATATTLAAFLGDNRAGTPSLDDDPKPVKVKYSSAWRTDYPKLKRGETLTYQGGEYFNENPGSNGLPAVVAMKAAEVVYDSATPSMVIGATTTTELNKASARIIRPLDRREYPFTNSQMGAAGLIPGDPASSKVIVVAERWYFKDLSGSLQKRFYFDSLSETLVFRGRLNDKESGDPNLTAGPDPLNVLEPGVMTLAEYKQTAPEKGIRDLSTNSGWTTAIDAIFRKSQNPNGLTAPATSLSAPVFLQGVKPVPPANSITPAQQALVAEQKTFWNAALTSTVTGPDPLLLQLDSFGVGSALVPNPSLLTQAPTGSLYVTIAENNRAELDGAPVSLHIIEIIPDRYRGAIKVIEGSDAFSEKITLQHNGEFGANTGDLDYEWWIRDARELDTTLKTEIESLTTSLPDPDWQLYASGPALHTIVFQGRPDVVLADKLVLMRYRHENETRGWTHVPFELPTGQTAAAAWQPGSGATNAPFQWAGAANSPQLQADGSKRYIPQLVMGWVKRVLDRINPYEARYTDFFGNESPASYSSQIQIAGAPYAGNVALNPDKNVIENTGLIELYRTVLARAESLSIKNSSNGNSSDGINQALLLAATRLSVLYELLAREAYSDAQDATISVADDDPEGLASVATYTHAFQNLEPDLLHEELSLLRGSDFRKSYPVYNRIFWNYAKGLGEAAYNSNYNIYDANTDGFINEDDARILYPQGHGDAWGHFLSAVEMHYLLLQEPNFSWKARSELYSLMQNVLPVDFLDEKTFARLAAGKARAGRDIVRATYREKYTNNPDGQWQGYTDSADPARAWGVSEWSHRAGQGAYFDWAVANALLPAQAGGDDGKPKENLAEIERSGAEDEIGGVAAGLYEIQTAMDESNNGSNPLGFSSDAIAFDIDPTLLYVGSTAQVGTRAIQGLTHFEQIFERAVLSGSSAAKLQKFATQANNKLRMVANDTERLIIDSLRQDLDYRNRLIEIFGRPYAGQIGFGKAYPEGYEGPDTMLYAYLDKTKIDQIVPSNSSTNSNVVTFTTINNVLTLETGVMNDEEIVDLYEEVWGSNGSSKITSDFTTLVGNNLYQFEQPDPAGPAPAPPLTLPYNTASKYAFQAPADWGQRTSYGKVQTALGEMLAAEIALDAALSDYIGYLQDWEQKLRKLQGELEQIDKKSGLDNDILITRATINSALVAVDTALGIAEIISLAIGTTAESIEKALPIVTGIFDYDVTSIARGIAYAAANVNNDIFDALKTARDIGKEIAELLRDELIASFELDKGFVDSVGTIRGLVEELVNLSGGDQPKRDGIGLAVQELELKRQEYTTARAEGFRLLKEREAFNKVLAAKSQRNRYQDMTMRLTRNEAMAKYQSAFNLAARHTWLAAKAYDYETSLDPGDPAAATQLFDQIVKERQLGLWTDGSGLGDPKIGKGGLAEILALLRGNFDALEGRIGLNNVQIVNEGLSMRAENFRIGPPLEPAIQAALDTPVASRSPEQVALIADNQDAINEAAASNQRWQDTLKSTVVEDLWAVPEYRQHCRPITVPSAGKQPGLVIRFSSTIGAGQNFFGRPLTAGDHAYSTSQFSTRIAAAGILLADYQNSGAQGLASTPRAYLVPVGTDYCLVSTADFPTIRSWSVKDARVPTPYVINQSQMNSPSFIPRIDGIDGTYGEVRRHADFRMFHGADLNADGDLEVEDENNSTRLMARSIWNSQWVLIIPGSGLYYDPAEGVKRFTETVSDIKLNFKTYSHNGQ
jgi:hypothetical protein